MSKKYGWCLEGQHVTSASKVRCPGKPNPTWQAQTPCSCPCHTETYALEDLL